MAYPDPATHNQNVHETIANRQHLAPDSPTHQRAPRELPNHVATQHAAMAKLPATPPPATPAPRVAPARRRLNGPVISARASRTLAVAASIAVMGGYIWLHNYPKLALSNANNQAGIEATLPSYLPNSYGLQDTSVKPGSIILTFHSPGATEPLKIGQTRTSWDSNSLLDNYVTKKADGYATVQSQGLTIYLYDNNHATWINHGIWYSIEGASRLSREQILKIAYSL